MAVHQLSRLDARRIAVRAQLLDIRRPTGLLEVVRRLTMLQIDPVAAVAPTADLVAWSRLGSSYASADLVAALENRDLIERPRYAARSKTWLAGSTSTSHCEPDLSPGSLPRRRSPGIARD